MNRPCMCDHSSHFNKEERTPNGNPAHKFGQPFHLFAIKIVPTPYGEYHVCKDCADDCLGEFTRKEEFHLKGEYDV